LSLADIPLGRYNPWGHRRGLFCADRATIERARAYSAMRHLTPAERSAFYVHELTGCQGLEFAVFSNVRLETRTTLAHGVIVAPCFPREPARLDSTEPLDLAAAWMEREGRYLYDGWIPISMWAEENVRAAVRRVDEALSALALAMGATSEWVPKYETPRAAPQSLMLSEEEVRHLEGVVQRLQSLPDPDRTACYRSLGWLSQGRRLTEPTARFLFAILAIESLATHIERKVEDSSPLAPLRRERTPRAERTDRTRKCIAAVMQEDYAVDPVKAIQKANSLCLTGSGRMLEDHLEHVLGRGSRGLRLFLNEEGGESLARLRNRVAHGSLDTLSDSERQSVAVRVRDAERVAYDYVWTVVRKVLGAMPFTDTLVRAQLLHPHHAVAHGEGPYYLEPTHMALLYPAMMR
jgi:hypothetical protein